MTHNTDNVPLKRGRIPLMVLFTLLTAGLYVPIWYFRRRKGLNALDSSIKIGLAAPTAFFLLLLIYIPTTGLVHEIALLCAGTVHLVMAFRVRSILIDHLSRRMNEVLPNSLGLQYEASPSSALTFFFTIFYLQYKINEFITLSDAWTLPSTAQTVTAIG
jgi:hypothetical protein